MSCYLCKNEKYEIVEGKVRDVPNLKILKCTNCGLVYLENFNHIQEGYYENASMNDFGSFNDYVESCIDNDNWRIDKWKEILKNKNVLDFGCGLGGFMKGVQDICKIDGCDLDPSWKQINPDLDIYDDLNNTPNNYYDNIMMFHVLEHLKDPINKLKEVSDKLNDKGQIFIEVPNANDALLSLYKCKAFSEFTYWGCHLYLFTNDTLRDLVNKAGLKLNFIIQVQRYPLANHLYWLIHGKPGGHKIWKYTFKNCDKEYEESLASIGYCDTIIAGVSK
jgi:2-polyprenyl-3-methyl-5-hydroxy-6-metoxy-1,4-benzoquinol methylase